MLPDYRCPPRKLLARWLPNFVLMLVSMLASMMTPVLAQAGHYELYTDVWPPYINAPAQESGRAARLLELLAAEQEGELRWRYLPYDLSFELIRRSSESDKAVLGYPYFKTATRAAQVLFSEPVFTANTRIYYNRQFLRPEQVSDDLQRYRIGRVSGYSYGETLDAHLQQAIVFGSEIEALNALFAHDIDLLPMTEGVMEETLQRYYPERKQLLLPLPGYQDRSSLHVVASRNAAGERALQAINASLARLRELQIAGFDGRAVARPRPADVARLIAVEGYPAVLGQTSLNPDATRYYTLPQGTRVLVIEWSERMLNPSASDRFYKVMMALSRVVVLNGPHAGKELFVRNMHIELL